MACFHCTAPVLSLLLRRGRVRKRSSVFFSRSLRHLSQVDLRCRTLLYLRRSIFSVSPSALLLVDDSVVCLTFPSLSNRVLCRSVCLHRRDGFRVHFLHEASLPAAPSCWVSPTFLILSVRSHSILVCVLCLFCDPCLCS